MHISELSLGQRAKIVSIQGGQSAYRQKIIAMGLLPGTEVRLTRIAPLGDPVEIEVRGVALSLRKSEANILTLEGV